MRISHLKPATLLLFAGIGWACVTESTGPVVPPTNDNPIRRATITGKIVDYCTNNAVAGAVISVGYDGGVSTTTSDASGSFSFGDVPVSRYEILNGQLVANDVYTVTASLVDYNQAQTDSAKRYRNYYYQNAILTYTSTTDSTGLIGLIGSVTFMISELNTTIEGKVVDRDMQDVPNAVVTVFDQSIVAGAVIAQTTTNATGDFTFNNIDNGVVVSLSAMNSDGSQQGTLPGFLFLPCNLMNDSLRSHVVAERIRLTPADNVAPFVIAVTPENNADVTPGGFQAVFTFSEPIKQTPYTRTDLGIGHGTIMDAITINYIALKKGAAQVVYTAQWNASFTQLTVSPEALTGSARYTLNFIGAAGSGNLRDYAGNALVNNTLLTGDFEILNFTTNGGSAVPAAPTLTRRLIPGLYVDLDFTGGNVNFEWTAVPSARSYNVYKKTGNGAFELLAQDVYRTYYTANSGALVTPYVGVGSNPLYPMSVQYAVRAVSADLVVGPASTPVTVSDAVKPQLVGAVIGGALSTNLYPYTLSFTEPMDVVSVETSSNFTFSNTGGVSYTVQRADYLGYTGGFYVVRLTVATSAAPIAGYVLTIGNNVTDLSGNIVDSAANSQTF